VGIGTIVGQAPARSSPAVAPLGPSSTSVILISVDTLRADYLGCYGKRTPRTPHIDAITRGGTLFSQINAQVPLTLPSHVSLLTSTLPFVNGLEDNGEQVKPGATTLAGVLKSHGYRTAAFVGGFVLDRHFGLDQGFDFYDSPFDLHRQQGKDPGDIKRLGEDVTQAATRWLDRNSAQSFFLFLHLYDLHTPRELPPALRARYRGTGYQAELSYVDDILGRFWEYLDQKTLLEKTLIVFTSDHGESLSDHGETTHGYFIYQSTLWVPLIIHWPVAARAYPSRVDDPASLLDVGPTILQFLGVPQPREFQGRSLLELLTRTAPNSDRDVYSESLYPRNHLGCASLRCLRLGRYKYIEAPKPELYDLTKDPTELHNLYARRSSLALSFRERLSSLRTLYQGPSRSDQTAPSPEVVARLSSLGYVALSRPHGANNEAGPDPKDRINDYEQYGRALVLASSRALARSNAILEKLLAKDPGLLDVRNSLGLNLQRLGKHNEAIKNFRELLTKDPLNVLGHFNLAVSYYETHQLDEAVKELQLTLAIAPYYTHAEELLGTIWLTQKDYARARSQFNHLLTAAPDDYGAHYNLGVLDALEGRWDEGVQHLRAALRVDPQSAEAHNALGSLSLRKGDLGAAAGEFTEALRLDPKFPWAHYNLGLVFQRQNRLNEAIREFHEALTDDPQFQAAREALYRLEDPQR
jgi:tetratricopeptide (TPR) repeat protein